jgi:hypothetical protein
MIPFHNCIGKSANCRKESSTIRSLSKSGKTQKSDQWHLIFYKLSKKRVGKRKNLWTVIRMDCGEAEAVSVNPRAFFSLEIYFRNNKTLSSNGITWGIFWSSSWKNCKIKGDELFVRTGKTHASICSTWTDCLPRSSSATRSELFTSLTSQWSLGANGRLQSRR